MENGCLFLNFLAFLKNQSQNKTIIFCTHSPITIPKQLDVGKTVHDDENNDKNTNTIMNTNTTNHPSTLFLLSDDDDGKLSDYELNWTKSVLPSATPPPPHLDLLLHYHLNLDHTKFGTTERTALHWKKTASSVSKGLVLVLFFHSFCILLAYLDYFSSFLMTTLCSFCYCYVATDTDTDTAFDMMVNGDGELSEYELNQIKIIVLLGPQHLFQHYDNTL